MSARTDGTPSAVGAISVASDPVGASVYVDGKLAGRTPVKVDMIAAGDHRVRLVKDGYLENGRVVAVTAGKEASVTARLTPDASGGRSGAAAAAGGGGSKKWIWIAAAGGGGAAALIYFLTKNSPPVAGTITNAPGTAILGTSTSFTSAGATDPDGDPLTYSWTFGDAGTGTGATTTHIYSTAGSYTVTLTISDGKKSVAVTSSVTVKSLTGTWTGPLVGSTSTFNTIVTLTQSGTNLTGTYNDQFGVPGAITGTIDATSRNITFTTTITGFVPWTFTGSSNDAVTTLTGLANGSGFVNRPWTLSR